jgi:type II secretory pathway predicted ATPase ExeA
MDAKQEFSWKENPFTLKILPHLFVGYDQEINDVKKHIEEKDKLAILLGPTGAGKTTMLKWLAENLKESDVIYISKPPKSAEEFIHIFQSHYPLTIFDRIFSSSRVTLYELPTYVAKKSHGRHVAILLDEAHEADVPVLEWMRTFVDQIENSTFVMAGLPRLEDYIRQNLETLYRRVTLKVTLNALSRAETEELIRRRITFVGGKDISPFTINSVEAIYKRTGGFPREILKVCNALIKDAERNNTKIIDETMVGGVEPVKEEKDEVVTPTRGHIETLPKKQEAVLKLLLKEEWLSPSMIAQKLADPDYKDPDAAIRSLNNILKRLLDQNLVVRRKQNREYVYSVADAVKTSLVEN